MKITVGFYQPPRNAVFRESPVMAVYVGNERIFCGSPLEGIWKALDAAGVEVVQYPNEQLPPTAWPLLTHGVEQSSLRGPDGDEYAGKPNCE